MADISITKKLLNIIVEESAKFVPSKPNHETILVTTNYLLMRWTNARLEYSVHRVLAPGSTNTEVPERYSSAFFSFPDVYTIIEPLSTCYDIERPKKWGPINASEYLFRKKNELYALNLCI